MTHSNPDAEAPESGASAPASVSTSDVHALVTGAAGFVGVNLVRALAAAGARVTALARRPPDETALAFVGPHDAHVRWIQADVTDRSTMRTVVADGITRIVHAAAVTATLDQERASTARVFDVNAGGTLNLLEAARKADIDRFVLVSSGGLYGPAPPHPALTEATPMRSSNLYGIAKAASESLVERYAELHGFTGVIGRLGTTYGPMERPSGSRSNLSAVQQAVLAFRDALEQGRPVRVRGADVARDFLHVDDAADAFVRLTMAPHLSHSVYNVGAPRAAPLAEALDALADSTRATWIAATSDDEADVVQGPGNARAAMDMTRLERDLGWRMAYGLAEGSLATLAWERTWRDAHPDWFGGRG